jgi:hypothetical protein
MFIDIGPNNRAVHNDDEDNHQRYLNKEKWPPNSIHDNAGSARRCFHRENGVQQENDGEQKNDNGIKDKESLFLKIIMLLESPKPQIGCIDEQRRRENEKANGKIRDDGIHLVTGKMDHDS